MALLRQVSWDRLRLHLALAHLSTYNEKHSPLNMNNPIQLIAIPLALSLLALAPSAIPTAHAKASSEEVNHAKQFQKMVGKLDKLVKQAKKRIYVMDAEVPKLQKRVTTAGYRVNAARSRYNKLIGSKDKKSQQRRAFEQGRLKKDADKLGKIIARTQQLRTQMTELRSKLKNLSDDVAIEADRFNPGHYTAKRAMKLVAASEWALERMDELMAESERDVLSAANDTMGQTQI